MNVHHLARILDLVSDPRMPTNFIGAILRSRKFGRIMSDHQLRGRRELLVAFTCDVERPYGSHRILGNDLTVAQFLRALQDSSTITTIFIEGSLVEGNSEALRSLENKNIEMGLHGYVHELWGKWQWYLSQRPLTLAEKDALLEAGINSFRKAGLKRPVTFRAPNLVIDTSTMRLLLEKGFHVDSSLPSHKGVLPIPRFLGGSGGLVSIPVTADPRPSLSLRGIFPYYKYLVLNLKNLKEIDKDGLRERISLIVALQEALGFLPHIVVLSHSWEFSGPLIKHRDYSYCSIKNFEFRNRLFHLLSENFVLRPVSMATLGEFLNKANNSLPGYSEQDPVNVEG